MIYYPLPLYKQEAFQQFVTPDFLELDITELLCNEVLSLPIHTEMNREDMAWVCSNVKSFFTN
jgi:dTDP-4-amino-4,6-dideoxygalactose transaminase